MKSFRISKLKMIGNNVFDSIELDFFGDRDVQSENSPYFTLIIGPNGTGKSNILKFIIEIFRYIYERQRNNKTIPLPQGKFFFEYILNNKYYVITNSTGWDNSGKDLDWIIDEVGDRVVRFHKNKKEILISDMDIPQSILALSIMLTDKYLVLRDSEQFQIYKYLGVRRDSNTAGTRSYISKTIQHVFEAAEKKSFLDEVRELLSFLDLEGEFYVSYSPKYKHIFFTGELTLSNFKGFYSNWKKYLPNRTTEPWSIAVYKTLSKEEPELIPKLVDLLNYLSTKLEKYADSRSEYFEFNLFTLEDKAKDLFHLLPYLHRLNIISYPALMLKKGGYFDLEESSSGEYHFISTIIGLLATMTQNSVVLIDEPEISLHPNWQMKYIKFLNQIFKKYTSCHFIVCTHSHFLVSDLRSENSSIISLAKSKNSDSAIGKSSIIAKQLPYNTFGWSAEDVLYNIFNVRSSLNYYLEADLTELLGMISNNIKDVVKIKGILNKLEELPKRENDPLQEIIFEAKEYLNTIE